MRPLHRLPCDSAMILVILLLLITIVVDPSQAKKPLLSGHSLTKGLKQIAERDKMMMGPSSCVDEVCTSTSTTSTANNVQPVKQTNERAVVGVGNIMRESDLSKLHLDSDMLKKPIKISTQEERNKKMQEISRLKAKLLRDPELREAIRNRNHAKSWKDQKKKFK